MENAVVQVDEKILAQLGAISPAIIVEQVRLVQTVMSSVMRQDEHYGVIPGTKKNCLFKSGAEKLCFTFQLTPEFVVDERNLENSHREYVVTCHLVDRSGRRVATGVGSCSTLESKYRYRGNELIATGEEVPKAYWDLRKANPAKAAEMIGKGRTTKKDDDNVWRIYEKGEKGENPDIADVWNTVLKMAKKRAHVDATITATAASDIFTQDVDDLPQYAAAVVDAEYTGITPTTQPRQAAQPATNNAQPAARRPTGGDPAAPSKAGDHPSGSKPGPASAVDADFTPAQPSPAAQTAPAATAPPAGRGQPQPAAQPQAPTGGITPAVQELLDTPNPEDVAKQRQLITKLVLEISNRSKDDAEALKADWRNAANAQMRLVILDKAKQTLRELCA